MSGTFLIKILAEGSMLSIYRATVISISTHLNIICPLCCRLPCHLIPKLACLIIRSDEPSTILQLFHHFPRHQHRLWHNPQQTYRHPLLSSYHWATYSARNPRTPLGIFPVGPRLSWDQVSPPKIYGPSTSGLPLHSQCIPIPLLGMGVGVLGILPARTG